jgi:hypothetical protein
VSTEENSQDGNLARSTELCTGSQYEALERTIFGLTLAIATEPSKLGQLRQMLVQLQEQRAIPEDFSTWALEHIDERALSMALEYADDAEILVQILSFKGGTFASLLQDIEGLYQQERISQRVYVTARLLLRAHEPPTLQQPTRLAGVFVSCMRAMRRKPAPTRRSVERRDASASKRVP